MPADLGLKETNTMNSKTRIALAGAACVLGCAFASAATQVSVPAYPAAAADGGIAGPSPSPAHVWMSGHWNSVDGQWRWVAAHWELPPSRSAIWVGGHWISQGGTWAWSNGAWNVADSPQSQAEPPQPPGQVAAQGLSTGGQAAPMPSTPAPYVYGEYAPGGVVRAIDQPPETTDYGPISYGTAYPGYAWTYDPWYWGLYPWALIGWGGGYWGGGYGHGGYGHGGHGGYHGRAGSHGWFSGHGAGGHGGGGHFH